MSNSLHPPTESATHLEPKSLLDHAVESAESWAIRKLRPLANNATDERFRRRSHRVTEVRLSPQWRGDGRAAQPIFAKLLLSGAR